MKNILIASAFVAVLVVGFVLFTNRANLPQNMDLPIPTPTPITQDEKVDIHASFTIITGNITRSFKAEKYHNQSPNVYIENPDPTVVHVTKSGITWDDFFKTLPTKLTVDCLITGDGETLCDEKDGTLKFYLNEIENPDLLDKEIKEGDKILIKFTLS